MAVVDLIFSVHLALFTIMLIKKLKYSIYETGNHNKTLKSRAD